MRTREFLLREKQEAESKFKKEGALRLSQMSGELKAHREHNKSLETQLRTLKASAEEIREREKKKIYSEMDKISREREKSFLKEIDSKAKEILDLKSSYEVRIKNMESAFQAKLKHIRTELENDLCSERKRYEIFKSMKDRQTQEMEEGAKSLQTKNQELLLKEGIMERSLKEQGDRLSNFSKQNARLKDQNSSLQNLWRDLQSQNEESEQRIQALQKLNKALSLSCNQMENKSGQAQAEQQPERKVFQNTKLKEDKKTSFKKPESPAAFNHILADIHFD